MLFTTVLKDNKAFLRCYKKGRFCADSFVAAYFYPNGSPYNRLGITAGKKQGCAVTRNRIKRIVRAAYRLNEAEFPLGYDIVFVGSCLLMLSTIFLPSSLEISISVSDNSIGSLSSFA